MAGNGGVSVKVCVGEVFGMEATTYNTTLILPNNEDCYILSR